MDEHDLGSSLTATPPDDATRRANSPRQSHARSFGASSFAQVFRQRRRVLWARARSSPANSPAAKASFTDRRREAHSPSQASAAMASL